MEFLIPFSKVKRLTVMKLMAFSIIDYLQRKEMRFRRSANVILLANLIIYNPDPTRPPKSNKGGALPFWNSPPFSPQLLSKDFAQIVDPPIKIIADQPIFFVRQRKLSFLIRPLFNALYFPSLFKERLHPHQFLVVQARSRKCRESGCVSFCRHRLPGKF